MLREFPTPPPVNKTADNNSSAEPGTENIFRDQKDVYEFVSITAKHLSYENQPIEAKILKALTNGHSIEIAAGADVQQLVAQVRSAVSSIPEVKSDNIPGVVMGVVSQFKKMAELEQAMGPNFMETFIEERHSK